MKWRVEAVGQFYDPSEGLVVYFDPASGDTHLISEFAAYLVRQLALTPLTLEEITEQIEQDVEPEDQSALITKLPDIIDSLVKLDVVQGIE